MADYYPSYGSPTKSSLMKAKPVSQIRERLQQLSAGMTDVIHDQQNTNEQLNSNVKVLSKQIKILKNAFTELGDNFLNELFRTREELSQQIASNESTNASRNEARINEILQLRNDNSDNQSAIENAEQSLSFKISQLQDRQRSLEDELARVKNELQVFKSDQLESQNPRFQDFNDTTAKRLSRLEQDVDITSQGVSTLDRRVSCVTESCKSIESRLEFTSSNADANIHDIRTGLTDLLSSFKYENQRAQENSSHLNAKIVGVQSELHQKLGDVSSHFDSKLADESGFLKNRVASTLDVAHDVRSTTMKLGGLEDEVKAVFRSVDSLEKKTAWNNDNMTRAVQQLARQMNLPNPIYSSSSPSKY